MTSEASMFARAALVGLLLGLGAPAWAADPPPGGPIRMPANPDSALKVTLEAIEGAPLPLSQAMDAALERATSVRAAEADLRAARGAARRERGAFDPELFASTNYREEDQPAAPLFSRASVLHNKETTSSGGARVTLPFGTQLSLSLDAVRFESDSAFTPLSPQYDATGTLSVRQPLLKGFGPGAWGERSAVNREYEAARARYEDAVLATRSVVERTYWDLYAAERDLAVARLIRDQAVALLAQAELRNRAGLVGPNQVANARVFLAEQEQAVFDREESLDRVSDQLASLMGTRPPGGGARYRPTDSPPGEFPVPDQESLVQLAIAKNHGLKAAERDLAAARARHVSARWNAYPQLDFIGTLGGKGLAGTPRDSAFFGGGFGPITSMPTTDFGDAWSQTRDRKYPTWSAGLQVTVPLGFRRGAGERDRLRGEADRAEQDMVAARRSLEERVRAGHRELTNATKRLVAARSGVDAAFEQVRIGVIEYQNGRTTAFELVRLGADVGTAQQRYSQALVRTAKAVAELRLLTSGDYPGPIGGSGTP
ncbi:MAG TPA: TolC family protein [Candidatus Eisenbacteria bacterium]|nr:TolC family protein [Candidatus Eisenbacteria bacterium]